ncbi:MAG: hypothetical protein ACREHG_01030, partial [Candidatus Saccharimonadales bacterium]
MWRALCASAFDAADLQSHPQLVLHRCSQGTHAAPPSLHHGFGQQYHAELPSNSSLQPTVIPLRLFKYYDLRRY